MPTNAPRPLEALLAAAGINPGGGVQICAAAGVEALDPAQPALVLADAAQPPLTYAGLRRYPPETAAQLLIAADNDDDDEGIVVQSVALSEIASRLDAGGGWLALALPAIAPEEIRNDPRGLRGIITRLRDPVGGCPWDLAQDHRSLRPHLLEETYEVLDALDGDDAGALEEELGDLLMQVVLHAQVAQDAGSFDLDTVSERIRAKLVHRHPHVFGGVEAETPDAVADNWDRIKADERADDASALDGVPRALPALARAQRLTGRSERRGFAWPDDAAALDKLAEELGEFAESATPEEAAAELGDVLFVVADFARRHEIEAEDALREACTKFERRFRAMEASARTDGAEMRKLGHSELLRRWEAAKGLVG